MKQLPYLLASDAEGNLFEIPELRMAGMNGPHIEKIASSDLIELPYGSNLYHLPKRYPVGFDPKKNTFVTLTEYKGEAVFAAAAFMAPAYLQKSRSAFKAQTDAPRLPLFSYTAVGWMNDQFYVPAIRTDKDPRQDLIHFDCELIEEKALAMSKQFPKNRLIQHIIEKCVLTYGCPAARNMVLERWEAPAPSSQSCNASCLGCISFQNAESCVPATQNRLDFTPSAEEIIELGVLHLERAPRPIYSFGQGCEGEPILNGELLEEAIGGIRKRTQKGIINLNSNASRPDTLEKLYQAGLDSIRVSLNSAQKEYYHKYYRPRGYGFEDVCQSLQVTRDFNKWSSLNYLIFPGLTDQKAEWQALDTLLKAYKVNMIQTRNLNIDPDWYIEEMGIGGQEPGMGINQWITQVKSSTPWVKLGYFNPPKEEMQQQFYL
ncbi:MAG: radical SAM protein [Spirochaetales bacterium]|nr:radical SAM protein [Spirochaetales bacterium]